MSLEQPRVPYVEDDERLATLTTTYLARHGVVVAWTRTGEEALAMLESFAPEVVLLDVMLPGASGHEICRAIRARLRCHRHGLGPR